ncbi:nickel transporter [bacterium]|nr:nickel transporter [bacterium]
MGTSNPASGFPSANARPPIKPQIIPVLDVMGGQVVRAVGGRRSEYRPVRSVLTDSTEPGEVAKALVGATCAAWVYVADLDAIIDGAPDLASVQAIHAADAMIRCDGGFRTPDAARKYVDAGATELVLGTETTSPGLIRHILRDVPDVDFALSIDLFNGRIIGDWLSWGVTGPDAVVDIVRVAVGMGIESVILLDLAHVGTGAGTGTEHLISACRRALPNVGITAGGGVRTWADVDRLGEAGADAVLVASALHDGTLRVERSARGL